MFGYIYKRDVAIIAVVLCLCLGVGSFFDYQISSALFNIGSMYGRFVEAAGELPFELTASIAGVMLVRSARPDSLLDMITTSLCKKYLHHTACPAACQACRSKNRKQAAFCGNLHLRDGRKSFTISAAKAVRPAWGCAAFFVLGGKENEGNENDCAGAGGLSGS